MARKKRTKPGPTPMTIKIRGRVYKSAKTAARSLGVAENTVHAALGKGTLETVGTGTARPNNRGGKKKPFYGYASMREASLALGKPHRYVSRVLREGSHRKKQELLGELMQHQLKKGLQEQKAADKLAKSNQRGITYETEDH